MLADSVKAEPGEKVPWSGLLRGVQPRIRLTRSFDERSHSYLGYCLSVYGSLGVGEQYFVVGVGKAAHEKHRLRSGDVLRGFGVPVRDGHLETADLYRVSGIELLERGSAGPTPGPPWHTLAPPLPVYRERGHRRLDAERYAEACTTCVWGAEMAVELIVDQWNPHRRKYRRETFCYGPLSCNLYKAGPRRRAPGRKKGMSYTEEDWVDGDTIKHREEDPDA
jgi:hypothetical protein